MKRLLAVMGVSVAICLYVVISGCVEQKPMPAGVPANTAVETSPVAAQAASASPAAVRKVAKAYERDVAPLTTEQCAQCHTYYYNIIKKDGGKHQLECTYCHTQFHTYRPGKVNYEDIVPKCNTCHGLAHGESLAQCLDCHSNAHTPIKDMKGGAMDTGCATCHGDIAGELQANKSKHTDVGCSDCHTAHRLIPNCGMCHQPHLATQTDADCLGCHPVHKPLQITYPVETPQETCGVCHPRAMEELKKTTTKHTALTCAKCHPKHRQLMNCKECHGQAHSPSMLKGFKGCGDCHNTAHALPKS
ncbi:MAG: cytochrome c3 family protein [Pseudomonadota bacterium]